MQGKHQSLILQLYSLSREVNAHKPGPIAALSVRLAKSFAG
jgi:hypothetical protein